MLVLHVLAGQKIFARGKLASSLFQSIGDKETSFITLTPDGSFCGYLVAISGLKFTCSFV